MSEEKKAKRPKRRWLRRLGWGLLILLAVLVVFHRPIVFEGTRYFVVRAAKQQHLDLSYTIGGSIFTGLTVSDLKAVPTEQGPIQRLEVKQVNLKYSLYDLVRKGLPAFLDTVEVKDVFVEMTPGEPLPPEKEAEPQAFKFPALFPETLKLENINFLSHAETGNTELAGLYFTLLPDQPGVLKIAVLDIPGVRRWEKVAAATTFRERNLKLTDLVLGPEIALRMLNLDASRLEKNELGVALDGTFFQAATTVELQVADLNAANKMTAKVNCAGLSFEDLSDYLNLNLPVTGSLGLLAVTFQGEPEKPLSWSGHVSVRLDKLAQGEKRLGTVVLESEIGGGTAVVNGDVTVDEANSVKLTADVKLPEKAEDFVKTDATARLVVTATDLSMMDLFAPELVTGKVSVVSDIHLAGGKLVADATVEGTEVGTMALDLKTTRLTVHAEKDLLAEGPVFKGLAARVEGTMAGIRVQEYTIDTAGVKVTTREGVVALEEVGLVKGKNTVRLDGDYTLPEDMASWTKGPAKINVAVDAPALSEFALAGTETLKGRLQLSGHGTMRDGQYAGEFLVTGRDVFASGLTVKTIDGRITVAENKANVSGLTLVFNERNTISANADVQLAEPYAYSGSVEVGLKDLSIFQPLLGQTGPPPELRGSLIVNWQGTGNAQNQHNGALKVEMTNGRFGDVQSITANVNASYTPTEISAPRIRVSSSVAGAELSVGWKKNRLAVTGITVRQQQLTVLSGNIDLPLNLAQAGNPNLLFPNDQPVKAALRTDNLNLATLLTQLGQKEPPIRGIVNMNLTADGTLDELVTNLSLRATRLQSPAAETFAPADLDLDVVNKDDRLKINGTVRQSQIQPLRITGDLPFDIVKVKNAGGLDPNTPLQAEVTLPRSSLMFLSAVVPAIRQARGTAAVNVKVGGTIAQPDLSGRVDANLDVLRFVDTSLPPVSGFVMGLSFARDRLNIEKLSGNMAGGTFRVGGNVGFAPLDNPTLNVRLNADNALVLQNDDITARVSTDVLVAGPMNGATVSGNVWVTRSRFFKNIDILPIGLPGRPAPQPPSEPMVVSFRTPPLRDWKFNVTIQTRDPFLIQGNLARGSITMNLKLGGTGLEPWLDGSVRIDQLTAALPFSRLDVSSSLIYFNQAQPFIPQLDIRGTSNIRDYNVRVNVFGSAYDPQAVFSSDPPLPQSEVVSLIATGMTTKELANDPNALAGRAAILVIQKAYRSLFQRNRPPSDSSDNFLSRIQFDIGTTDPKTGKQSSTIRIPLSDRWVLMGGLDVGGNFRGQVKYLVRFQ